MKTEKSLQTAQDLNIIPWHKEVIDAYFDNGFNQRKAVMSVKKDVSYEYAGRLGSLVFQSEKNKMYIQAKQNDLSVMSNISTAQIVQELKNFAFADLTDFTDIEPEDLKTLGPDVRRALKKVTKRTRTRFTSNGEKIIETNTTYEIHDKLNALDKLAKYIGLYEADNRQKGNNINVLQLLKDSDPRALNSLLTVIEQSQV